ncbi:MAG: hypothetical protein V4813_06005, partial [Gemmatimonadota bacterium]
QRSGFAILRSVAAFWFRHQKNVHAGAAGDAGGSVPLAMIERIRKAKLLWELRSRDAVQKNFRCASSVQIAALRAEPPASPAPPA